jgi:hypothetical protein
MSDQIDELSLRIVAGAFADHPNRSAVRRLLDAIGEMLLIERRLRAIYAADSQAGDSARRIAKAMERSAAAVRLQLVEAAAELGIQIERNRTDAEG